MSEHYYRAYLCPDPDEHGELAFVDGVMRPPSIRRGTPAHWERIGAIPDCPICYKQMVHDTDDGPAGQKERGSDG